ncbi:MAG: DEAD/DEAH box helicase [Candidatus Thermoplasmatota archaeon]|nr:DEAD/DEAH box helicase [Candidatus Thermoplasmatota archaeon]
MDVFKLLDEKLRLSLADKGIIEATLPQEKLIPLILSGEDVLLLAPTGSGKTEAAILPVFSKMLSEGVKAISTLYITPLRALNRDMLGRLIDYGKEAGLSVMIKHSDISDKARRDIVVHPPNVLITTPESLQIMLNGKRLRVLLESVRHVIVDEVHELAQNERGSQFAVALERLRKLSGGFQVIGLSATVGNPEDLAKFINPEKETSIVKADIRKLIDIQVEIPPPASQDIVEKMGCDPQYAGAVSRIWELIGKHRGTLVFVNTRSTAEDIAFRLKMWLGDIPVLVHHGSLSKDSRESAERDFKVGKISALICTSSLELGIDIGLADLVVQFNSPRQVNKMAQRIGRSGHWIKKVSKGVVICNDLIELEEAVAIASLVRENHYENIRIREGSMATLANQVLMELNFTKSADKKELQAILCKAYPFRQTTPEEFDELLQFLASTRKIWIDGDKIGKKGSVLSYYLDNISMIPSEKNYRVIDIANKKFVGTLDERYVVNEIEPGSYFVMRGSTWRTSRIDEDRILAEPFLTPAIAPKWSGEDIPVLLDVTRRVSDLRTGSHDIEGLDDDSLRRVRKWHEGNLATMDRAIIESRGGEVVIQSLLGTRGNFAMGEILASILTAVTGESAEMDYSPYHVYLRLSRHVTSRDILGLIRNIEPDKMLSYINGLARRSRFFNGVFMYEARKFGVISTDSELGRIRMEKIIDAYHDTVLFKDSVRKLVSDYMDIETLEKFLTDIKAGNVRVDIAENMSDSSSSFLAHYLERVVPIQPTKVILEAVKNRLLNEQVILLCTRCKHIRSGKVKEMTSLKCEACGSTLVAAFSEFERDRVTSALSTGDDKEMQKKIVKNAHLIREKGKTALLTLAARGVGTETANRLLEVSYANEDDLIKAILNAEMDYSRNRRFWS